MKLYHHPISTTSRTIMLFAAESGIALDMQVVDLFTGEHMQPAYAGINPNRLVPTLEDGGFVRNPHVTIFVDEANSQGVTVLGEVAKPGIYSDPADRKLYEVISLAGGFTGSAARKIAVIRRGQADVIHIDLPRNLADDVSGNIDVLPGDTITVPKAPIIYVVGDVGRPSGLLVDNGQLTVLQALALAGGTNRTAKMGGARIIRKGPTGMTETRLKLKQMLEAKTPDVTLQADDILFVPVSAGRVAAARTIEAATAMATAIATTCTSDMSTAWCFATAIRMMPRSATT